MTEKTQGIFVGNRLVAGTPTPSNFTKKVVECTQAQYDEWKQQGLLVADTPYLITDGGDVTIINDTVVSLDSVYSSQHTQALLDSKANTATTYSKAEVDGRIKAQLSSALKYKGKVATVAALPVNPSNGDSYVVESDGLMYAWSDTSAQWDALGSITDLTDYYTKAEIDQILSDMQVKIQYSVMPLPSAEFTYPIQYIGVSDDNYTSGNFYSAVEESGSYVWKEVVGSGVKIFYGTQTEWDNLTTAQKVKYDYLATPLQGSTVVDKIENGNMNPVTSNAVYDALDELHNNLYTLISPTVLTTTSTNYTLILDRKLSDYNYFIVLQGDSTSLRNSAVIHINQFKLKRVILSALHGTNASSASDYSVSTINVQYVDDTTVSAYATGSAMINTLEIIGVKITR